MKKIYYLILLNFILCSCGSNEFKAKQLIAEKVIERSKGYFKLATFEKISAITKTIDGIEYYTITYNGEVEVVKSGGWVYVKNNSNELVFTSTVEENIKDFSFGDIVKGFGNSQAKKLKVGEKYFYSTSTTLIKYEERWKVYF